MHKLKINKAKIEISIKRAGDHGQSFFYFVKPPKCVQAYPQGTILATIGTTLKEIAHCAPSPKLISDTTVALATRKLEKEKTN